MTREEMAYNYASKKKPSKFTVGEIAKHYDDGYSDGKEETIKKALDWIDYNNQNGGCNFDGWEEDFKNYMEGECV